MVPIVLMFLPYLSRVCDFIAIDHSQILSGSRPVATRAVPPKTFLFPPNFVVPRNIVLNI